MDSKKYRDEAVRLYLDGAQLVAGGALLAGLLIAADGKYAEKKAIALENELKHITHVKVDMSFPDCPFITDKIYPISDELLTWYVRGKLNFTAVATGDDGSTAADQIKMSKLKSLINSYDKEEISISKFLEEINSHFKK